MEKICPVYVFIMTIICFRGTWLDYLRYHLATCTPYTVDRPMPLPKLQCDDTQGPTARRWNLIFTGVKASTVHIRSLEVCLRFYQTDLIMLWFQNTHSLYYASAVTSSSYSGPQASLSDDIEAFLLLFKMTNIR